jgi:dipeptidyl aminopeptidase/acylaminoacyl peptidase
MRLFLTAALLLAASKITLSAEAASTTALPSLQNLSKPGEITSASLSPDGKTIALVAPYGTKGSAVLFLDADTLKTTTGFRDEGTYSVGGVFWLNNERLAAYTVRKFGGFAEPVRTGEIFAFDKDGGGSRILYGNRGAQQIGTNLKTKIDEDGYAELIDPRFDDEKFALITVDQFNRNGSFTELRRVNKRNGQSSKIATAPIRSAEFIVSEQGLPVFAYGPTVENDTVVYAYQNKAWAEWFHQRKAGYIFAPLALSKDGKEIYGVRTHKEGPDSIIAVALADKKERLIYRGKRASPVAFLRSADQSKLIAIITADDEYGVHLLEPNAPEGKIIRGMMAQFPGQFVRPISVSRDGSKVVFFVSSGANSGEYYVFDAKTREAKFLFPRDSWLDPKSMATIKPVQLKSRDGLELNGYLTLPPGREAKNLALVVMPHGGPHGIRDYADYDPWAQVLATRGYAVLKVNFRGSGGYGETFESSGYRQWGQKMIDDITDATRFVIAEGYADKDRIAIAGASFGGYAALMSAAREPELYRAAISFVGLSDLEMMFTRGLAEKSLRGNNTLLRFLGDDKDALRANSPVNLATQFQAPVLILHGTEDFIVPVQHGRAMKKALESAGKTVEYFEAPTEGHGFYLPDNVLKSFELQLAFLEKNLRKK